MPTSAREVNTILVIYAFQVRENTLGEEQNTKNNLTAKGPLV